MKTYGAVAELRKAVVNRLTARSLAALSIVRLCQSLAGPTVQAPHYPEVREACSSKPIGSPGRSGTPSISPFRAAWRGNIYGPFAVSWDLGSSHTVSNINSLPHRPFWGRGWLSG